MLVEPLPENAFASNLSPMFFSAPPPWGSAIAGTRSSAARLLGAFGVPGC
jgi:hypothetical protein